MCISSMTEIQPQCLLLQRNAIFELYQKNPKFKNQYVRKEYEGQRQNQKAVRKMENIWWRSQARQIESRAF